MFCLNKMFKLIINVAWLQVHLVYLITCWQHVMEKRHAEDKQHAKEFRLETRFRQVWCLRLERGSRLGSPSRLDEGLRQNLASGRIRPFGMKGCFGIMGIFGIMRVRLEEAFRHGIAFSRLDRFGTFCVFQQGEPVRHGLLLRQDGPFRHRTRPVFLCPSAQYWPSVF